MDSQMAVVVSVSGRIANIELGNSEIKSASIPLGLSVSAGSKVLITQTSGKYLIINTY